MASANRAWPRWASTAIALCAAPGAAGQECRPHWSDAFPSGYFPYNTPATALAPFDPDGDGPLPPLVALAAPPQVRFWDGARWARVSGRLSLACPTGARAMIAFDPDGSGAASPMLIVGGAFASIDGVAANNVAYWDGAAWRPIGAGLNGPVNALLSFDPDGSGPAPPVLVAGGEFTASATTQMARVAVSTDLAGWSALGAGLNATVHALASYEGGGPQPPALIAAGGFTASGAAVVRKIARWSGVEWEALGGGAAQGDTIRCLTPFDPDGAGPLPGGLAAGGFITSVGGAAVQHAAYWNGQTWSAIGSGLNAQITSLSVATGYDVDPQRPWLIAAGDFTAVGATPLKAFAAWDGSAWRSPAPIPNATMSVRALCLAPQVEAGEPQRMIAAGRFTDNGLNFLNVPAAQLVAGAGWQPLHNGVGRATLGAGDNVWGITTFDADGPGPGRPVLAVVGDFSYVGSRPCGLVAMFDGLKWRCPGDGLPGSGRVFAAIQYTPPGGDPNRPLLVVGGDFGSSLSNLRRLARWDGTAWSDFGGGANFDVNCLAIHDPDGTGPSPALLVAGGVFGEIGGTAIRGIAAWNGHAWLPFGLGLNAIVWSLYSREGASGPELLAGVQLLPSYEDRILRWDGDGWSQLGGPAPPIVQTITEFDPDGPGPAPKSLFIGSGAINSSAAGVYTLGDNANWTRLGSINRAVPTLAVFDDGSGPALFAGGGFRRRCSQPRHCRARSRESPNGTARNGAPSDWVSGFSASSLRV